MFGNFIIRLLPSSKKQVTDRFNELNRILEAHLNQMEKRVDSRFKGIDTRLNKMENTFLRLTPRPQLAVTVALAQHCNLRCVGCDVFSPIAEPEFTDVNEFKKDLKRLAELFNVKLGGGGYY